ncbi:MAG: PGF-pre-PGF domain-containing protein, partial [Candidatus Hadarchaeales archaeon]
MEENIGGEEQVPEEGAGIPALSRVDLQVRVSTDGEGWSEWMGPDGTPNTLFTSPPADLSFLPPFRYLQVRVLLRSEDPRLSGEDGPKVWGIRAEPRHGRKAVVGRIRAGEKRRANFGGRGSLLRAVSLRAVRDLEGVEVYVSPGKPEEVPPLEGKRVLAYVEISPSVAREDLEEAEIEFAVPKGWLRSSNPSGSRAVLFHYGEPRWEELPTVEVGEEGGEILFLARTPGFSTFAFVDNTNEEFSLGTHENTENVGDVVRLIYGYTQGRFTSRVFDAGGVAQWDNLVWSFTEPQGGAIDIDYVWAEPDTLKDGSGRVGTQWQGTYENAREPDGSYENLGEAGASGSVTYTVMENNDSETVYAGGIISTENAREPADTTEAGGSNYENIYENAYSAYVYTYAQTYENSRGKVENFDLQQQEAGGYTTYFESSQVVYSQTKAIAIYSTGTETPAAKEWNGSEWVSMPSAPEVSGIVWWVLAKSARTRNELILGTLDDSGDISISIWDGTTRTWSGPWVLSNVGTTSRTYRCFDIEYENGNDRAIVVYNNNNETDNLWYVIWDGTSWSDPEPIPLPTTGIPRWVELASNPLPDNNDLVLIYLDSNSDVFGFHWNGSTWDNMGATAVWDDTASTASYKAIDVAYEFGTGDAMFVWGDATTTGYFGYRTYVNGVLSGVASGPASPDATPENIYWVLLVSDPLSDDLLLGLQDSAPDLEVTFWSGTAWSTRTQLEGGTEAASDMNFYLTFEIWPGNEGHAWAVYGEGTQAARNHYANGTWTETNWGDDVANVYLETHWFNGTILGIIQADDGASTSFKSIFPVWSTSPGSWNNMTTTPERFVTTEITGNPQYQRSRISCRRHWPALYGLEIYENIDNIPLAENYYLEIYYKLSNTFDKFHVYVENAQSPNTWVYAGDLYRDVWTTFSFQLTPDFMFAGGNVHIKIVDNDNTKESFTNIYVDYVRVKGVKPGNKLDVVHTLMAPTGRTTYTLEVEYYITGDNENIAVYLWDFDAGQWVEVGLLTSHDTPSPWSYELTGTSYILGTGKVRVRYLQTDIPTVLDTTSTSFMLNYTRVKSTTTAGQSLNWQHTITGVTTGYDNYDLKIRGYSYGDLEYIWIDVWNVVSGQWESTGYYLPRNAPSTITFRLSPIENYLDGDSVHIRFRDDSPSDATTTYLILDMVRIEEAFWATSDVKLQVRVSGDNSNWTDWMGPDGTSSTYFEAATTTMENIPDNRYIQYRIYFSSQHAILTGENGPKVDWVRLNVSTLPNLIYPTDGLNLNNAQPTFQWESVAADNYRIQIATDYFFNNVVVDNSAIPGTENAWTPPIPLDDGLYYWRIQ